MFTSESSKTEYEQLLQYALEACALEDQNKPPIHRTVPVTVLYSAASSSSAAEGKESSEAPASGSVSTAAEATTKDSASADDLAPALFDQHISTLPRPIPVYHASHYLFFYDDQNFEQDDVPSPIPDEGVHDAALVESDVESEVENQFQATESAYDADIEDEDGLYGP